MAETRETLTLIDNFSGITDKFISGMQRASNIASASLVQIQSQSATAIQQASAHMLSGKAAVENYAAELSEARQKIASVGAELKVQQTLLSASISSTGEASTETFKYAKKVESLTEELSGLSSREKVLNSMLNSTAGSTKKAQSALSAYEKQMRSASNASSSLTSGLKGTVATLISIQSVKAILNLSDQMTQAKARLDMMNDGLQTTNELNNMVRASANNARGSYANMANMVGKLGTLAGDAFNSSKEIVAFAEQFQKHLSISGADANRSSAAILQMTQALSSGVLRGEELNSILENAPSAAQAIAKELGVSVGEMRNIAAEGKLTAEVVKNAMLGAADETNATFEQIPYTWSQVGTMVQNIILEYFQPVINIIGEGAQWIQQNWSTLQPILMGVGAAILVVAAAIAVWKLVTLAQTIAQWALNAALLANPITWIVIAIAAVVGAIVAWIQSVGGLRVAWLIAVDAVLTAWDYLKYGFFVGVYWVQDKLALMQLGWKVAGINIANFVGDMKTNVLVLLQNMVNGAIDIINWFIEKLNSIPGVSIDTINQVTFGAEAQLENEAAKQARQAELDAATAEYAAGAAEREASLASMAAERDANHAARQAEIAAAQSETASSGSSGYTASNALSSSPSGVTGDIADNTAATAYNTGEIKKSVDSMDEDLKMLEDVAIRRYEAKINSTQLTPSVTVNVDNSAGNLNERGIANAVARILVKQSASATTAIYSEVTT